MRLAINLDNLKSVMWDGSPLPREIFTARHDRVPFEVKFLQGGVLRDLPEGAVGRAGVKVEGLQAGAYLAYAASWVKSGLGRDAVYTFVIDLNTVSLESLFTVTPVPAFVSAVLEIEWGYPIGGAFSRETSLPIKIRISNDYIQGNEAITAVPDAINSLEFSAQGSAPAAPAAGKRLFLNASGKFSAVDDAGNVELLGAGAGSGAGAVVSATAPANPVPGMRWIHEDQGRAYEYLDGTWVELSGAGGPPDNSARAMIFSFIF